jgi:ADP-dependent NAD(P)H-hydrate dehydratase / NAD(P)H-hydrate epimerase
MKVLTAAEMREVDRLTIERLGKSSSELMETAGKHVAEAVLEEFAPALPRRILVLCGKGNNGGDGLVAARHFRNVGLDPRVCLFGDAPALTGDAGKNLERWLEGGGKVLAIENDAAWENARRFVLSAQVIVDGLLGTGLRGAASGLIARAIEDINLYSRNATSPRLALILAVDTPSGLPSDGQPAEGPVLGAHKTVTFTAPKVGQLVSRDSAAVGSLRVVDIGSPAALVEEVGKGTLRWSEPQEFADLPLVRAADGQKGLYGHILIVAGSLGKSGAAVMSGSAALWAGAGLVTVATPDVVLPIVAAAHPEYMTEPLAATGEGTVSSANRTGSRFGEVEKGKTVLAIGPGLGQHPETQDFIRSVVQGTELPVILDADGLNAFAGRADDLRERKSKFVAITPHPGEMARLLGSSIKAVQEDRVKTAQDAAKRWNVHVILKGAHTIVAAPDGRMFVNSTGNAGLAKGGSGDVLTGVLAAMTGQFKTEDWLRTLALGVYLHGAAADVAATGTDLSGLVAGDVARAVPATRLKLLRELQRRG